MYNRDQNYINDRLTDAMDRYGADAMILTWPHSVFYATGFASSFLYTSRDIGLSIAVVGRKGDLTLICSNFEVQEAERQTEGVRIITYPMFVFVEDFAGETRTKKAQNDPLDTFRMAVEAAAEGGYRNIAVEKDSLDYSKMQFLMDHLPRSGRGGAGWFIDAGPIMQEAKRIKGNWEIDIIRDATRISEAAMDKTGAELEAGMTHARIANLFRLHCLEMRDDIIFVDQYHAYGPCFSPAYVLHDIPVTNGDIIRLDGGPVINGYYSDIARNYCVGGTGFMTDRQKSIYEALYSGRERGRELIGPGMKISDVFDEVLGTVRRAGIPDYDRGHHGHSIGCSSNSEDAPFISRTETGIFEPGMVMCFEVSYYGSINHSYNIEDTFVITEDGAEWFTTSGHMFR